MMIDKYLGKTLLIERECEALLIPHGYTITLVEGSVVRITQALGDNFTLEIQGNLVLLMGQDRDALGLEPVNQEQEHPTLLDASVSLEDKCQYQMKRCFDPEIPVNVVDLGLIYATRFDNAEHDSSKKKVYVAMTLTAPTCGMGPVIVEDIKRKLMQLTQVEAVEVELVFDPPWAQEMMSEAARLQLGLM